MSEREQPKPEQVEAKVETPAAKPTATEAPKVDARYGRAVSEYFAGAKEAVKEDPEVVEYLDQARKELHTLSQEKNVEDAQLHPEKVGMALGELAGRMGANPDLPNNLSGDPKIDADNEKLYLESKKLFMESCRKIFPDAKADLSSLRLVTELAKKNDLIADLSANPEIFDVIRMSAKLQQEDPKKLASALDLLIKRMGDRMQEGAFDTIYKGEGVIFETDRPVIREKMQKMLGNASETVYVLQLMRDELKKRMYGRADIPPSDAKKIDTIRAEVRGTKPEPEKAAVMTEEEIERKRKELDARWKRAEEIQRTKGAVSGKEQQAEKPKLEEDPELGETALRDKEYELGKDGPFKALYAEHKTPAEVKRSVTPEMKRLFLEKMLKDIDMGVKGAEEFVRKNPDSVVNRKGVAHFSGIGVTFGEGVAVYQKIAIAAEGRVISPKEIAGMPMVDYLKRFLGYDLRADKKRAELLDKFTNALS